MAGEAGCTYVHGWKGGNESGTVTEYSVHEFFTPYFTPDCTRYSSTLTLWGRIRIP